MAQSPLQPRIPTRPGDKQRWGGLVGTAKALCLAQAAKQHNGLTLVITADGAMAASLESALQFFLETTPLLHFPDWETLPYDYFSPHQDIISERLLTLHRLPQLQNGLLIVPITTLLHRLPPPEFLHQHSLVVEKGQAMNLEKISRQLTKSGYRVVETVYEHGEFAVRGSLLDVFPMGSQLPYRIDLFDDEVESLRTFEPETQRTLEQLDSIRLLPAKEYPLDREGIAHFRDSWHQAFDVDHRACPLYQDVTEGIGPAGIEYYLPLFFEQSSTLFDYLPENALIFTQGKVEAAIEHFWQGAKQRYENRCVDPERPILEPNALFLNTEQLFGQLKAFPRVDLIDEGDKIHQQFSSYTLPNLNIDAHAPAPLAAVEDFLLGTNRRVLFCAESAGRRETLLELLARIQVNPLVQDCWQDFLDGDASIAITISPIAEGLLLDDPPIAVISEGELFGHQVRQTRRRNKQSQESADQVIKNLTELHIGAPVVHIEHGVGRYRGLEILSIEGQSHEFLVLEYAKDDKLYVPVANLDTISRYTGADEESAPLHRLGSDTWSKARRKAAEKVRDVAAELLDIYAKRAAKKGFQFTHPQAAYESFAKAFPFEETPDQERAIANVCEDMFAEKAMDRLVCGDVGFGKTEVAMRAAFIAVHSGKQVAILVPTTLLAQQHFDNFKDRFADWPVTIEVLSRFRSDSEVKAVLKKLNDGKIDIIIGTHKLLQADVKYHDLGLVIIDEEHRFGVRQKDKLKSLRAEIDILTLTATPIPRTLNMSMAGIRDLSIIGTPPAKRLSVKTFVREADKGLAKEAVSREIMRGGQVYYLHNDVKTIEKTAQELQELVPEARVAVGHGQLRERQLEKVMGDFYHKRFNVLVCSTIIETGIDVPNANTIIIDRADKFGLAQLHQLRGRVGRSHHQAYAYLMTPPKKMMSSDAVKRLEAIANTVDLGAGFTLATHDLEIRGAGELLGEDQSGQIETIGFSLYMELLDRAVQALRQGKTPDTDFKSQSVDINLRIPVLIPDDYLPDVHTRLILYKRIANALSDDALRELQVEMIDRFGLLPEATKNLFKVSAIKLQATALGIVKIEAGTDTVRIEFGSETRVDPLLIVKLVQNQPQIYQLSDAMHLKMRRQMETAPHKFSAVEELLTTLSRREEAA
jgi:transcription-repair coupling factor (superfamily II helicase)